MVHWGSINLLVHQSENSLTIKLYNSHGYYFGKLEDIKFIPTNQESPKMGQHLDDTMKCLISILEDMNVDVEKLNFEKPLIFQSLDSLRLMEFEYHVIQRFSEQNPSLKPGIISQYQSIKELAEYLNSTSRDDNEVKNHQLSKALKREYPLSPQQAQLVFMNQYHPSSRAQFVEKIHLSFENSSKEKFVEAIKSIIRRHSILRSIYTPEKQIVQDDPELIVIEDGKAYPSQISSSFSPACEEDAHSTSLNLNDVFDITKNISITLKFHRPSSGGFLKVTIFLHHIAIDGRSIEILMNDLQNYLSSKPDLSGVPQYVDYVTKTIPKTYDKELGFWNDTLKGVTSKCLPTDLSRPAQMSSSGALKKIFLEAEDLKSLLAIQERFQASQFEIFLSIVNILIYKTTMEREVVLGFANSLRTLETINTVGCFANTLPFFTRYDPELSIEDFFRNTKESLSHARKYGIVPFERIVDHLKVERSEAMTPIFQVLLVMDSNLTQDKDFGYSEEEESEVLTKYDQTWYFRRTKENFEVVLEYCTDLYYESTVEYMLKKFVFLLNFIAENFQMKLKDICLLTDQERSELLQKKKISNDYPEVCLHQFLELNDKSNSKIFHASQALSYQELSKKASVFSQNIAEIYRIEFGVNSRADDLIGVKMIRGFPLLITIFGLWKAGLAPIMIDPEWPDQRIKSVMGFLDHKMVITENDEQDLKDIKLLKFEEIMRKKQGFQKFWNIGHSRDLAYVTCTSGSTGVPKAICTEHYGLSNLAMNYTRDFCINTNSTVYQVVSPSFDIFFADIIKAVANGSNMVLASGKIPDSHEMEQASHAYIMPVYLSAVQDRLLKLENLKVIQFGGEALAKNVVGKYLRAGIQMVQEFGLTEQSVYSMRKKLTLDDDLKEIGQSYNNLIAVVRDGDGQLVNHGLGLYWMSGLGLMRGYLGNQFCDERFTEFGREICSGDIFHLVNGKMHFVGRKDGQLKLRGRRIELNEIEAKLVEFNGVESGAVIVKDDQLVAHLKMKNHSDQKDLKRSLRDFISIQLPDYMIPNHFVFHQNFPLTSTGKIDKISLQHIEVPTENASKKLPKNRIEVILAEVWCMYLKLDQVSVDVDFFEAGGNSLLALLIVEDSKKLYKLKNIDIRLFFTKRTIENIAMCLKIDEDEGVEEGRGNVIKSDNKSILEPSFFQVAMYRSFRNQHLREAYNMKIQVNFKTSCTKLRIQGFIKEILSRHPALRCKFIRKDGRYQLDIDESMKSDLLSTKIEDSFLELQISHVLIDGHSLKTICMELNQLTMDSTLPNSNDRFKGFNYYLNEKFSKIRENNDSRRNSLNPEIFELNLNQEEFEAERIAFDNPNLQKTITQLSKENCTSPFITLLYALARSMQMLNNSQDLSLIFPHNLRTKDFRETVGLGVVTLEMKMPSDVIRDEFGIRRIQELFLEIFDNPMQYLYRGSRESSTILMLVYDDYTISSTENLSIQVVNPKYAKFPLCFFIDPRYDQIEHPAFRTQFIEERGLPKQKILEDFNIPTKIIEVSRGPLVQGALLKIQDGDFDLLFLHLHHILSDAYSTNIMTEEFWEILTNPDQEVSQYDEIYKLYLKNAARNLKTFKNPIDKDYIRGIVKSSTTFPELEPTDITTAEVEFPKSIIEEKASKLGTTPFIILSRTVAKVFMDLLKLNSLNIGLPFANRNRQNRNFIGCFLNNLILPVNIEEDDHSSIGDKLSEVMQWNVPYMNLLNECRRSAGVPDLQLFSIYVNCRYELEADTDESLMNMLPLKHHFPVEINLDKIGSIYRISGLCQVKFNVGFSEILEMVAEDFKANSLSRRRLDLDMEKIVLEEASKVLNYKVEMKDNFYALGGTSLEAVEFLELLEDRLSMELDLQILYKSKSFREIVKRLISLTSSIATEPRLLIKEDPDWISGPACDTPNFSLPQILYQVFRRHRENTFIQTPNFQVKYGDSFKMITLFKKTIEQKCIVDTGEVIKADDIVGIHCSTSPDAWYLCLAVILSGSSYCPIDKDLIAPERFKMTKEYCKIVVSEEDLQNVNGEMAKEDQFFNRGVQKDLAYVIFTSGTTGEPKGVCIEEKSIINMALSAAKDLSIKETDMIYQFTKFCFDNSVLEVFSALFNGAAIFVDPEPFRPKNFVKTTKKFPITHALFFPGLVAIFPEDALQALSKLRYWIVGAEKLSKQLLERALDADINVIQNYGPTETTAYCLTRLMKSGNDPQNLGRPICNTSVRVMNGELVVKGRGLMRGYLDSSESFEEGFRTGDLVKLDSEGNVIFIGRNDAQVKIRGNRVDLNEIEQVISNMKTINQVKIIFEEEKGKLYCYFTASDKLDANAIRIHCDQNLESYKIPNFFIQKNEFGLTPNNKIDKLKLKKSNEVSESLKRVWLDILEVENFKESDHFFLIGGNSLLLMKLSYEIEQFFGKSFSINKLLENLQFNEMVEMIRNQSTKAENNKTIVFFPTLYGKNIIYNNLIKLLKNHGFVIFLGTEKVDFRSCNTIEQLCQKYKTIIEDQTSQEDLVFIGASCGEIASNPSSSEFDDDEPQMTSFRETKDVPSSSFEDAKSVATPSETASTTPIKRDVRNAPNDRYFLVYMIFTLHGVGMLMSWNMFITIAPQYYRDYWFTVNGTETHYANSFMSIIGVTSQIPNVGIMFVNMAFIVA
ncbi:hypothetical protein WR25_22431 [Diploscapter pachys]|uniref:Carrier domain-containing protein n=1 Tax=Diploscapter pachys TaxID=2018661 RepID=A0A2A2LUV8_9BILA|nr:hypothetical protein WR25_22431 [Diploscapter pachys]